MVTPSSTEPSSESVGVVDKTVLQDGQWMSIYSCASTHSSLVLRAPGSERETFLACRAVSLNIGAPAEVELSGSLAKVCESKEVACLLETSLFQEPLLREEPVGK